MSEPEFIKPYLRGPAMPNLAGHRFSRLLVLSYAGTKNGGARWNCLCDCGKTKAIPGRGLRGGTSQSCGCLRIERAAIATSKAKRTHGHSSIVDGVRRVTRTYGIWTNMHTRCSNPKSGKWERYGGRGIKVCERWGSFENFLADMGECPGKLELERKNNDLHYEPDNCRWATRKEQCNNRHNSVWLTIDGITMTQAQWSEQPGAMRQQLISDRRLRGWDVRRAVFEPKAQ